MRSRPACASHSSWSLLGFDALTSAVHPEVMPTSSEERAVAPLTAAVDLLASLQACKHITCASSSSGSSRNGMSKPANEKALVAGEEGGGGGGGVSLGKGAWDCDTNTGGCLLDRPHIGTTSLCAPHAIRCPP
jgi:hypothetical protein